MNRLLISAAHKSSGKTTVSIGLCHALSQAGHRVQPFKKGPDYIDPMWLSQATGRSCINLDFYTMQHEEIHQRFQSYSEGADISLIEGNKGLYDGLDIEGSNSNAALAQLLKAPVVLVIDVRGVTRGIAPLLLGYQAFCKDIHIAGVIFNQVGGQRHESKLRKVIEHYTDIHVIGAVAKNPEMNIDERHLGLIPSNEAQQVKDKIDTIGQLVAEQVDLGKLIEIAKQAPTLPEIKIDPLETIKPNIKIGIARDSAFGFYYQDDFDALRQAGAELVFFDTLKDTKLPEVDGLFIGGGFPESFLKELNANQTMRESIRTAIDNGLPGYAECGGLMYLCRSIDWNKKIHEMVGIVPADVRMYQKPQGRGYIRLEENNGHPWPSSDQNNKEIVGHEFHYSGLENLDPSVKSVYKVLRGFGIDGQQDGLIYKNLLACYAHLRDTRQNHWTKRFVEFVRQCKESNGG
ncbi:MAG: hydrogenobyrinic acid a,c-diamide synthase (glutamine-hydrolyzing) [Gammaproteobacteria bacterium]|nr:hydrogenobyrinic acid a,c-diamide synthase (glutamine-hydrolyzing) [Gammaproteobacteria bacterium]